MLHIELRCDGGCGAHFKAKALNTNTTGVALTRLIREAREADWRHRRRPAGVWLCPMCAAGSELTLTAA